ncbi:MAG: glycosyltransferase family A protein [Xenococcaceae cyanobacterium MO_188.B32]|nr:glycosyltransferase family A protein [Xenococcaceae cyanobacterium MO_188.B32]
MQVSVIITTHNRPLLLRRAYESVLNQTVMPQEIIIIDDASNIPIKANFSYLFSQKTTIKIHRFNASQGACKARNQGVKMANGDILMFLDDDDTWESSKISDQLSVFQLNTDIGLVYSGALIVKENARDLVLYKFKPKAFGKLYPQILYDNLVGSTSSVAIKKILFEEVGGFDENMPAFQDYDLWVRCCQKTMVGHDGNYNLRYTLSTSPKQQISGQPHRHVEASHYILAKYRSDIDSQGTLAASRIRAAQLFAVAKSLRLQGLKPAIPWIIASFFHYPNWKVIALIFPLQITQRLRYLIQNYLVV